MNETASKPFKKGFECAVFLGKAKPALRIRGLRGSIAVDKPEIFVIIFELTFY